MSISEKIKKMVKEAPVVSSGTNVNFGPLTVEPIVVTFHGRGAGNRPEKRTLAEFAEEQGVDIDEAELGDNDQLQLHFSINVRDLNPSLSFETVDRDIAVLQNSADSKRKTDWAEIVEPSLVKVFGPNWEETLFGKNGKPAKPVYVAAEMVDSLRPAKKNDDGTMGKVYTMPKFIAKYDSRDACIDARDERYGKPADTEIDGEDEDIEDEGEDEEEDEPQFPVAIMRQVYKIYKSNKGNKKSTITLIGGNKAWKQYNAKELVEAAVEAGDAGELG